jgi:mannose/fructose/N-acetylgalactosamine-specific phosphotransferase system component IID
MDPQPLANLIKRSNYDEPIASEFCALDYLYEVLLEICESENFDILKYCYENYAHNVYVKEFIERMTVALEENNDMHESIDN